MCHFAFTDGGATVSETFSFVLKSLLPAEYLRMWMIFELKLATHRSA
jgi:hypothetical protein